MLPAFKDKRYITVDGKPFSLSSPLEIPDPKEFIDCWQQLAIRNGQRDSFRSAYLPSGEYRPIALHGFDAVNVVRLFDYQRHGLSVFKMAVNKIKREFLNTDSGASTRMP